MFYSMCVSLAVNEICIFNFQWQLTVYFCADWLSLLTGTTRGHHTLHIALHAWGIFTTIYDFIFGIIISLSLYFSPSSGIFSRKKMFFKVSLFFISPIMIQFSTTSKITHTNKRHLWKEFLKWLLWEKHFCQNFFNFNSSYRNKNAIRN